MRSSVSSGFRSYLLLIRSVLYRAVIALALSGPSFLTGLEPELVLDLNQNGAAYRQLRIHEGHLYWVQSDGQNERSLMVWHPEWAEPSRVVSTQLMGHAGWIGEATGGLVFEWFPDRIQDFQHWEGPHSPWVYFDFKERKRVSYPPIHGVYIGRQMRVHGKEIMARSDQRIIRSHPGDTEWEILEPVRLPAGVAEMDLGRRFIYYTGVSDVATDGSWWSDSPAWTSDLLPGWDRLFLFDFEEEVWSERQYLAAVAPGMGPVERLSMPGSNWQKCGVNDDGVLFAWALNQESLSQALWRSDGSKEGTFRVWISPMSETEEGYRFDGTFEPVASCSAGKWLITSVKEEGTGWEVLLSDGSVDGTFILDLIPGITGSDPSAFCHYKGRFYFKALDRTGSWGLWAVDPETRRSELILSSIFWRTDFWQDETEIVSDGAYLYFAAQDPELGEVLFRSDGTALGTEPVLSAPVANLGSAPRSLASAYGKLFFSASGYSMPFRELYSYDPEGEGLIQVAQGFLGEDEWAWEHRSDRYSRTRQLGYYYPWQFRATGGGNLLFLPWWNRRDEHGRHLEYQLASSDQTPEGTRLHRLGILPTGAQIWTDGGFTFQDGVEGGVHFLVHDYELGSYNTQWLMRASGDGTTFERIHAIDETVKDRGWLLERLLTTLGDRLLLIEHLDRAGGVFRILEVDQGKEREIFSKTFTYDDLRGRRDEMHWVMGDNEAFLLFRDKVVQTDGTVEGTAMTSLFGPGDPDAWVVGIPVKVNHLIYFITSGRIEEGYGVYEYDTLKGRGRYVIRDYASAPSMQLTRFREGIIFISEGSRNDGKTIRNWIRYFGADTKEPVLLGSVEQASETPVEVLEEGNLPYAAHLTEAHDHLYLSMYSPSYGRELWVLDGKPHGLKQVADIYQGWRSANPYDLIEFNGDLYFSAVDERVGRELMRIRKPPFSWLGIMRRSAGSNWVDHSRHGWIYLPDTESDSVWFYDRELGWLWTSRDYYDRLDGALVFSHREQTWFFSPWDDSPSYNFMWDFTQGRWRLMSGF